MEVPEEMRKAMARERRKEAQRVQATLEEFRAGMRWGIFKTVKLRAEGSEFVVDAVTREGKPMKMAMARGGRERRFQSPVTALRVLKGLGLTEVMVDVTHWSSRGGFRLKRPDMSARLHVGHAAVREAAMKTPGMDKMALLRQLMEDAKEK